jgi:tRNA 2-thiouridine synthesizing protein A
MVELDLRGLVCPYPTSRTMEALRLLRPGETLEVISDYYPARQTIPSLARETGHSWELQDLDSKSFRVVMKQAGR